MGIVTMIVVGLIAGLLARAIMPGNDAMGWISTILLGIVGSFVGGFLASVLLHDNTANTSDFHPTGHRGKRHRSADRARHLARRSAPARHHLSVAPLEIGAAPEREASWSCVLAFLPWSGWSRPSVLGGSLAPASRIRPAALAS